MAQDKDQKKDPFARAVEQTFQDAPQGVRVSATVGADGNVSDLKVNSETSPAAFVVIALGLVSVICTALFLMGGK